MAYVWVIYGLYMGYPREQATIAPLLRQYRSIIMYFFNEERFV